jgi:hypothetical protein
VTSGAAPAVLQINTIAAIGNDVHFITPVHISFCHCCVESKKTESAAAKGWEIIADNLSKAGWSWGCVATVDANGRTIFVADAHRDDGKRFVVHADEKLRAFLDLEAAIRDHGDFFLTSGRDFSKLGVLNGFESGGGYFPR